jgi:hypothetical protein
LVVEDSNKLDPSYEIQLRSFLAEIANNFKLEDQNSARLGYQLNNNTQRTVFNLNKYDQTNDARSKILTTAFTRTYDGIPIIADALTYAWTNQLTVTNGERSCHPTVVILLSYSSYDDPNGGIGASDPELIANDLTAARQLKNSGALIIAIGVGPKRNPQHLLQLASGPQYYHDYSSFAQLTGDEADNIAVQACAYVPDGNFYPCEMQVVQADIVFVVDVTAKFQATPAYATDVLAFMNNTLRPYTYDHKIGVQAALITYQKDADIQINLNDADTLEQFIAAAQQALAKPCDVPDRCVEAAFDKIINHVFVPSTGYRPTCTIHQIYVFPSDCFNCADPIPLANRLRAEPSTEIFVVPLQYGSTPGPTLTPPFGFWKEYLEIAGDASHLWEAHPDPTPIVTEYLHKEAWRAVCRQFAPAQCHITTPTTTSVFIAPTTTTATTTTTTASTTSTTSTPRQTAPPTTASSTAPPTIQTFPTTTATLPQPFHTRPRLIPKM